MARTFGGAEQSCRFFNTRRRPNKQPALQHSSGSTRCIGPHGDLLKLEGFRRGVPIEACVTMTTAAVTGSDPSAEARKRRKEIIQSRDEVNPVAVASSPEAAGGRTGVATTTTNGSNNTDLAPSSVDDSNSNKSDKKPPKKRKVEDGGTGGSNKGTKDSKQKKAQIRYDPDVPMSKEQLAAWRREARRVRNRESAAASRQRIRNRITELEEEVGEWKEKYTQAMDRLQALEDAISPPTAGAGTAASAN